MSALAWAFLGGAAAIAFPVIFHLIRRTPKGRREFSSLMFLKPSPPRLTRRSRLDQLLLLLLRVAAIVLLALAFTRPFLRAAADLALGDLPGQRIAILVDTSASMRRGDLMQQAVSQAESVLDDLDSGDDVALFAFDDRLQELVPFDKKRRSDPDQKRLHVREKLKVLHPSWSSTNLGTALARVSESLRVSNDVERTFRSSQIVLIGDVQQGSRIEALQNSLWPEEVRLEIRRLTLPRHSNARARIVSDVEGAPQDDAPRVRVRNAGNSPAEQFNVVWANSDGKTSQPVFFYVPAGQSRVLRMPGSSGVPNADRLTLSGDDSDFDNNWFVVPQRQETIRIVYLGSDAPDNPEGLRYFLDIAFEESPARKFAIESVPPDAQWQLLENDLPRLVIVAGPVSESQRDKLKRHLDAGGHALAVLISDDVVRSLGPLLPGVQPVERDTAPPLRNDGYSMLSDIDFRHPLFAKLAGAMYNDFTAIRFWRHRNLTVDDSADTHMLARFDDGVPAVWEHTRGKGSLLVFSSGWNPNDSQLAVSSKFVPLMLRIVELSGGEQLASDSWNIGDAVPLPKRDGPAARIVRPDGATEDLKSEALVYDGTDVPGVYRLEADGRHLEFAVNLDLAESETAPLPQEQLEQYGVRIGRQPTKAETVEAMRQMRDFELEQSQKIWKWLVVAVLCMLGLETWLAGRRARGPAEAAGETG